MLMHSICFLFFSFVYAKKRGKGPALLNRLGDGVESVGSPSFRCYVGNGMQTDGKDIVAAICEQKKANSMFISKNSKFFLVYQLYNFNTLIFFLK
jgi:hypothetical protein